jgi:biopolymer transport protein TolR
MAGNALDTEDDDVVAQINVVPFVDIVLVLLIIFLLTANIIAKQSIRIDLPKASNAGDTVGPTVNVVVGALGELFVDGRPASVEELVSDARKGVAADSRLHAVIAADRAVRYERVVQVIDALKGAGVVAFALNIEPPGRAP